MYVWKPLAWLPNSHGYRCTVVTHSGNTHAARVVRNAATGLHKLSLPDGVAYSDLKGWKP